MKALRLFALALLLLAALRVQPVAAAPAPVCTTDWAYNFNVLPDGRVLAWNWSALPAGEQHADVWVNGAWVRALEVPALPPNSHVAVIGVLRDVREGDRWRVKGQGWCGDSGVIAEDE